MTTNWARCCPFLIQSLGENLDINVACEDVRPLLMEAHEVDHSLVVQIRDKSFFVSWSDMA